MERARYMTRAASRHWDESPLTRMSLCLEDILGNISVVIRDEELIVGCRTSKLKGAPLFPENKSRWIEGDVDNFDNRVVQRALISPEEKRELSDDILPFWQGRTVEERFESLLPEDVFDDMDKYIFTFMLEITYGIGHFSMDYARVLDQGLAGVIADAESRMDDLSAADRGGDKGAFYSAAIRSLPRGHNVRPPVRGRSRTPGRAGSPAFPGPRNFGELPRTAAGCRNSSRKHFARPCRWCTSFT